MCLKQLAAIELMLKRTLRFVNGYKGPIPASGALHLHVSSAAQGGNNTGCRILLAHLWVKGAIIVHRHLCICRLRWASRGA